MLAGAGFCVDIKGVVMSTRWVTLRYSRPQVQAAPPQPVGNVADLLIVVVPACKSMGLKQVAGCDEVELVQKRGAKWGLPWSVRQSM